MAKTVPLPAAALEEAHERIRPHAHRTPVFRSRSIDGICGTEVHFKCENLQRVGAFKFRGACNAVLSLPPEDLERGVATHSSGNHAQALALAAGIAGARAWIVMPATSPRVKVAAVEGYGGEVVFCEPNLESREREASRIVEQTGAAFIHPYNDHRIIAGQATAAKELLEEVSGLDLLLAPVGGGGLLSGTALAARHFSPGTRVLGVEPAGADDACRSLEAGRILPSLDPKTICDGLLTSLGDKTFPIIRDLTDGIVTVDDDAVTRAMRLVWERMKLVIEPSAAVPLAALLAGRIEAAGRRVGIILSGGNVDLDALPWMVAGR